MKRLLLPGLLLASCVSAAPSAHRPRPVGSSAPIAAQSAFAEPTSSALNVATQPVGSDDSDVADDDNDAALVTFETPYKLGMRSKAPTAELAQHDEQLLTAWNQGGRQGKWHPQPRVMVDNVQVRGKISDAAVLRETRKQHYWPIRKCYDEALSRDQTLHGKLRVQFTIKHAGTVRAGRSVGKPTLADAHAIDCIVHSLQSLKFPPTARAEATVTLDIGLNPGDLPVRSPDEFAAEPGPGMLDTHAAQAVIAGRVGHRVQNCYTQALTRTPSLWGRMALRADIDPKGAVRECLEFESTFPDPTTTACVVEAVRTIVFPAPIGGDLRLVIPFRFGRRHK